MRRVVGLKYSKAEMAKTPKSLDNSGKGVADWGVMWSRASKMVTLGGDFTCK